MGCVKVEKRIVERVGKPYGEAPLGLCPTGRRPEIDQPTNWPIRSQPLSNFQPLAAAFASSYAFWPSGAIPDPAIRNGTLP
jgi:hypothetical protein